MPPKDHRLDGPQLDLYLSRSAVASACAVVAYLAYHAYLGFASQPLLSLTGGLGLVGSLVWMAFRKWPFVRPIARRPYLTFGYTGLVYRDEQHIAYVDVEQVAIRRHWTLHGQSASLWVRLHSGEGRGLASHHSFGGVSVGELKALLDDCVARAQNRRFGP